MSGSLQATISQGLQVVTAMLASQNLSSLQERRKKLRLAFLFKLVEGTVPAICADTATTEASNPFKVFQ